MTAVKDDVLLEQSRRVALLRIGAISGLVGAIGYLLAFLLHGNLPDETTESVLRFMSTRPWAAHHLAMILCFMLWLAALIALANSLNAGASWALGRLGQTSAIIGLVVLIWHYNIDGPALEQVADAWAASDGDQRALHLERGTILLQATTNMFPLYVALWLGLPFILFGLAMVHSADYPSWLGWVGASAGTLSFVVGLTNFAGLELLPRELFVVSVFALVGWMLGLARRMWAQVRALKRR